MKQLFFFICIFFCFTQATCKKEKHKAPLEQLPPETQTGANTFGCLVNGKVFTPGGASLSGGSLQCNYQMLTDASGRGCYFVLIGRHRNNRDGSGSSIGLYTDSLNIQGNKKLIFSSRSKGNASASFSLYDSSNPLQSYITNENSVTGELWIKKLDTVNQIVSGTFWFDAVNDNGQKVEIREGRFDVRYTR